MRPLSNPSGSDVRASSAGRRVLPADPDGFLRLAEQAHRETSGSGGCASYECDEDDHSSAWHGRFVARLRELMEAAR